MVDEQPKENEQMKNRFDLLLKMIEKLGFPATVCIALLYGFWIFGDRVTSAHLETLKVVQTSVVSQSSSMEKIATAMKETVTTSNLQTNLLQTILTEQTKTRVAVETANKSTN